MSCHEDAGHKAQDAVPTGDTESPKTPPMASTNGSGKIPTQTEAEHSITDKSAVGSFNTLVKYPPPPPPPPTASPEAIKTEVKPKPRAFILWRVAFLILVNAAIPITLYYIFKHFLPTVWALAASPSAACFFISVILALANGDPKLMLMRESLLAACLGILCSITLLPIRIRSFELKPVVYYLGHDLLPSRPVEFYDKPPQKRIYFYWCNSDYCRRHMRLLTAIDIVILELEFGLKLLYILTFEIDTVFILSSTTLATATIIILCINTWYAMAIKKRMELEEPQMLQQAGAIINPV
ncbi:hypothetical protein BCR43DRAFT_509710 [Syncephalastrum racemosum]|uniref:Uncharacterized protein n=1 Tax=Syncephalastrum racemosum TaxID=13706 RepID=A0A1X2HST7_SYNRA|nr:hypothetical protein BCR43DRAFT_509710 [Syncephalastrum racemosum]